MDTDDFDDLPESNEPTSEQIAFAHDKADELERAAQKIGLYQQGFRLGAGTDPDTGAVTMVIVADFVPGDVAWSNRIQDPDTHGVDQEFRAIQSGIEADEFEVYREQLAKRLEDGDGTDS